MTPEQRKRAGEAVATRIAAMSATPTAIARRAGLSPKTVLSLIDGQHWPFDETQSLIESGLGWPRGELVRRAAGVSEELTRYSDSELAAELLRRLEQGDARPRRAAHGGRVSSAESTD